VKLGLLLLGLSACAGPPDCVVDGSNWYVDNSTTCNRVRDVLDTAREVLTEKPPTNWLVFFPGTQEPPLTVDEFDSIVSHTTFSVDESVNCPGIEEATG
jgi:hypothetical protein